MNPHRERGPVKFLWNVEFMVFLFSVLAGCTSPIEPKGDGEKVTLLHEGRPIYSYQFVTKSLNGQFPRANYIHPLYDFDGLPLTEDFPEDHLHQRGIFWAWHQVFLGDTSAADLWECTNIVWKVSDPHVVVTSKGATLRTSTDWLLGAKAVKAMNENLKIEYKRYSGYFTLDFSILLTSQLDGLSLGGSNDEKGYGGFSARLLLSDKVSFSNASGNLVPQNTAIPAGNWIHLKGIGESQADLALMYHPASSATLQGWILRSSGSMQNPLWPGRERVMLNQGEEVDIRARVVVFEVPVDEMEVERIYQAYIKG